LPEADENDPLVSLAVSSTLLLRKPFNC